MIMEEAKLENVVSHNIVEMLTVANEYCLFVEKSSEFPPTEVIEFLLRISPLLYLKGALLPGIEPSNPEMNQHFVTEEQWEAVYSDLKVIFGQDDSIPFSPPAEESLNPFPTALSECYADVYQDLKDFVLQFQMNTSTARENAVWDCRILFKSRWGLRLALGMVALHRKIFPETFQSEENSEPV